MPRGRPKKRLRVTTAQRFTDENFLNEALDETAREIRARAEDGLGDMATNLVADIQLRTTSGRDILGQFFKDYSPTYARLVKGRRQPVDLTGESGDMLGSLYSIPDGDLRWKIVAPDEKAPWHHLGAPSRKTKRGKDNPLPARPWFGVSEAALQRLVNDFDEELASVEQDGFYDFSGTIIFSLTE